MAAIRIDPPPGVAGPVWLALIARHATERALADRPRDASGWNTSEETLTRPTPATTGAEHLSSVLHAKRSRGERSR